MIILRNTLDSLMKNLPLAPPEMGGILGGKDNVVSIYQIDYAENRIENNCHYRPNIHLLNHTINEWNKNGLQFYGIFHTHFPGGYNLSYADCNYIIKIMLAMPPYINHLFFPIVLPNTIVNYQAIRYRQHVSIVHDSIKFTEMEDTLHES